VPDVGIALAFQAVRTATVVGRGVQLVARPAAEIVLRPPMLGSRLQPATWLSTLARRGAERREMIRRQYEAALDAIIPAVAVAIVRRIDAAALVRDYVDLDQIIEEVDLDTAAARIDIEALIDRVDLVGLVRQVLAEIDLPEIIRESTGAVASDTLRGVRMQTISADDAVARAIDRLRERTHRVAATASPGPPASPE
jgi:hypothetical protein